MTPTLSISIVNTNNRVLLEQCLHSLFDSDHGVDFEVILVDNVSTDGSADMVMQKFPQVQLIRNTNRMGFAANHNQAIRASRGKFILVLNEDTIVKAGALKSMCDYQEQNPRVGAVGPRLENPDGTLQPSCYKFPTPLRCIAENLMLVAAFPGSRLFGDYRAWPHDQLRDVEFVSGAAIQVRREVIETTGLLDDGFFIYSEETDWCYRMHKDKWRVVFVPGGTIVHFGGQSSVAIKDRQFCEFNRSGARYFRKHFGIVGSIVLRTSMVTGALLRIPIFSAVYLIKRSPSAKEKAAIWMRLLKLWAGFGPYEGIAELAKAANAKAASGVAPTSGASTPSGASSPSGKNIAAA
jgi:GT2 family glycosyltransferase